MNEPLLGRERLVQRAVHHLARDGGVVLAGLPWVGRTRLLREALARADAEHVLIRATRSGASTPFGNLGPIAPTDAGDPRRWLEQLRAALPTPDAIVAVDGAQFLDDRSAVLLLRAAEERAVRLAVSVWRSHPAPDAVTSLWTDGLIPRLEVDALDRETSDEMVRILLGGPVEAATLVRLWSICRGYPLLIREYVAGSTDVGALVEREGMWTLVGPPTHTAAMVDTARQVRVGLRAEAIEALDLLAVAQPLPSQVADDLVPADVLEQLERWDLYVAGDDGCYRLPAPGWAESLQAGITSATRRRLVRRLAEAMPAATELDGEDLVRTVLWHREAGLPVAGDDILRAALAAQRLDRHDDAAQLAESARKVDPVRSLTVLADARAHRGRTGEAVRLLLEAVERTPDHTEAARLLVQAARLEYFRAGRDATAVQLLRDGLQRTDDPDARAITQAELGLLEGLRGSLEEGYRMAAPGAADPDRGPAIRFASCRAATVAAMWTGRLQEARRYLATGRVAAAELGASPRESITLEFCEPRLLMASARPDEAIERAETGYREALVAEAPGAAAVWAMQAALIAQPAGRLELARRRATEAVVLAERDDEFGVLPHALGARALVSLTFGELTDARRSLARLDAVSRVESAHLGVLRQHVVCGLRAADGDVPGAAAAAAEAGRQAAERGQRYWAAQLLHVAARYGYPELVVEPLTAVTDDMEGDLPRLFRDHAVSLADEEARALERVAQGFLATGFGLWGAEALIQAVGVFVRRGDASRSHVVAARAGMLLERLSGARTPALHGFASAPLTRREREIALLAAEGRTSPEIAEQLVVSVRTVDNHLARVYRKLGISGRHELGYVMLGG